MANIHNLMSDVLGTDYRYNVTENIQIQRIMITQPHKLLEIEIVTEAGSSTACVISRYGFSTEEVHRIMNSITAGL